MGRLDERELMFDDVRKAILAILNIGESQVSMWEWFADTPTLIVRLDSSIFHLAERIPDRINGVVVFAEERTPSKVQIGKKN